MKRRRDSNGAVHSAAVVQLKISFQTTFHDPKLAQRVGWAVMRCIQNTDDLRARLMNAAADAHDELFPSDFTVEASFDEADIAEEEQ